MDIKYFTVQERVRNKEVYIEYQCTYDDYRSINQGLTPKQFKEHATSMGITESFDILG